VSISLSEPTGVSASTVRFVAVARIHSVVVSDEHYFWRGRDVNREDATRRLSRSRSCNRTRRSAGQPRTSRNS